ncbi:MAG TPA: SprB repeat-containing protein, partial [Flavobacterium sp.]|nr:SprB repeat-containing protein [Flavobacterium sp.]
MKKTLLCFLFLFTTVFYAQVSDIVHCSGDNNFDLSKQKIYLIGNLNPDETTVSYHLSLADATNNVNAIANPSNYNTAASSTTIYARIDNNGTITTNSFNVKVTPALIIAATNTTIACKGGTSLLTITASGGGGQYYYSINNGVTFTSSNIFNNLSAGAYTIQVLDVAASCPTTWTYSITEPTTVLNTTVAIVGQNATITAIGGTSPYQYSSDGNNYQASNVFPNLAPGNYIFRVRDSRGCVAMVSATILPVLTSTAAITKEIDCLNNASIAVAVAGGQPPYTYSLNGGGFQAINIFNNLTAGTYSIVVKDAVNTTSNTTYITVATPVPVNGVVLRTNPTSCSNASITIQATSGQAPYYYSIDNGVTFSNMNTFTNLQAGTYVTFIKDSKNCASPPLPTTIDPVQTLVATATNTPILCRNDFSTLMTNAIGGQPPYQYSINNDAYTVINSYPTRAGTYTIRVKDNNGCIAQLEYAITEPAIVFGNIIIEGQTISVINMQGGTGSYMYALDQNNFQTNNVFSNVAPGIHVVRVKDSNNCEPGTFSAVIEDPNSLISSSTITKQIDCLSNATITITATGGQLPYQYSIDGGITYVTSNIFNNLTAGTYTVTVKDALNTISQTNTITIAPPISVTAIAVLTKATNCGESDTVTITATSGKAPYLYSFDGSNTFTTVNTATGLTAGAHSLFVKDANGCLTALSIVITPSSSLSATITATNPYCSQSNDGRISLIATGGTAPYTYSIGNGYASSNIFNNLSAGYYNVSVKDALGCLYTMVAAIIEPTILSMTAVTTNSTTSADNDGTITVNAAGGVTPYSYEITDNIGLPITSFQTSTLFTGLKSGSYGVKIRDANGCITFQTNIVINKTNPLLATTTATPTTCLNSTGTITVSVSGGVGPYQYSLDNGATYFSSNVFSNLAPGNYSITVRDIENTTTNVPATIADVKPVLISATLVSAVSCNGANNGSIKTTVIQAQAPYVYKLDNVDFYDSNAVFTFNNLSAGEHTIQVIDNNGCTSFVSITIPEPTILNSTVAVNDKTISINTTGGVPPYSYTLQDNDTGATITGPQTSNVFTNLPTGVYSLQVIDSTICSLLKTGINISNTNVLSASFSVLPITCNNPSGMITVVATGGSGSYEYSLDNGVNYTSSNVFTGLAPGTYNINVKDSQNTTTTVIATISPLQPLLADAVLTKTIDCLSNASINVIASGGKKPYQYSFDNGLTYNANNTFTNINAGTYFVQVKDSLDCTVTTNSIVIVQPIPLYANFTTTDGTITTIATGGIAPYSYVLTDNSGSTVIPFQNSNIFTGLTNGSYGVEVRDATGCTYIKTDITIVNKPNSLLTTTAVTPTTCLNPTGTITVSVSGGVAPYQYSIDNGVNYITTNVFTSLTPGTYMIKVRDAENNITSIVAVITPVNTPAISATVNSNVLCKGDNTGSITAVATGGQEPYTYSLDGITFNTTNVFTNLRVGTFNITVKDTNGCTAATTIVLTEPAENLSATAILINDQGIIVNAKGGTAPYKYYLQNNNGIVVAGPQTDGIFTRLPIGRYSA